MIYFIDFQKFEIEKTLFEYRISCSFLIAAAIRRDYLRAGSVTAPASRVGLFGEVGFVEPVFCAGKGDFAHPGKP
jgi:hypothetical protein